MQIVGVCNYNADTVVFCHFPDETHGIGKKSDDVSGGDCCNNCHDVIDGRVEDKNFKEFKDFYLRRSQTRTIRRRFNQGILKL